MPLPELSKPLPEKFPNKEKSVEHTLGTAIGDMVRDIGTANQMAKEKFDGDSALIHAARGGATAMIGAVFEVALDGVFKKGLDSGEIWASRVKLDVGKELGKKFEAFANDPRNARLAYFIENSSKDFLSGLAYNAVAYFSNHMLPSAEAKHLLISIAADAAEAWGTKGLQSETIGKKVTEDRSMANAALKGAEARIDELNKYLKNVDMKSEEYIRGQLVEVGIQKIDMEKKLNTLPKAPVADIWKWQTELRRYVKFGNPATILGVDWMVDGFGTFVGNIAKVRKARKEQGGMPGKKVNMPQQEGGRRNYYDRKPYEKREYGNKPQYNNKDKVFYGKSQWNSPRQEEEVDLAKFE